MKLYYACAQFVGQATAYKITVTVDYLLDTGSNVLRAAHSYTETQVQFFKNIKEGDLTYTLHLRNDNGDVDSTEEDKSGDFCEDTVEAEILRGALLSEGKTSCPVRKGYKIPNVYDVNISDTEGTKLKCGDYTGTASVNSGDNSVVNVQFTVDLDESKNNCKQ